jgi:hypothetical protein
VTQALDAYAGKAASEFEVARPGQRYIYAGVSLIPNAVYPPDPAVVKALRRVDPTFCWAWITKAFRTQTGGIIVRGCHAMATSDPDPDPENRGRLSPFAYSAMVPSIGPTTRRPTSIGFHLENRDRRNRFRPGTFVPFDWMVYYGHVSAIAQISSDEERRLLSVEEKAKTKGVDAAMAWATQREREDAAFVIKNRDQITDEDRRKLSGPQSPKDLENLDEEMGRALGNPMAHSVTASSKGATE